MKSLYTLYILDQNESMLNISKLVLCAGQPSYLRPPSHCGSFNILHRPNLKGTSLSENHCLAVLMMLAVKYK